MIIRRGVTLGAGLLAGIGLCLILAGFFLVVPEKDRSEVAWLDLVVCGAVFLVNFATLPIVRPENGGFSRSIPRLGILWTTHILYTSLAVSGIWYGAISGFSFRLQLMYHLTLFFGLLVVLSTAGKASQHAFNITVSEQRLSGSLDDLKRAIADCEAAFVRQGNAGTLEYSMLRRIKDEVRYLSPCDTANAVSLELEMAYVLSNLAAGPSEPGGSGSPKQSVREKLDHCEALVRLRKQERFGVTGHNYERQNL